MANFLAFSRYDINGLTGASTSINDKTIKEKLLVKITDIFVHPLSRHLPTFDDEGARAQDRY